MNNVCNKAQELFDKILDGSKSLIKIAGYLNLIVTAIDDLQVLCEHVIYTFIWYGVIYEIPRGNNAGEVSQLVQVLPESQL